MPATDEFWRSLPRTHKVFAVSAVALLATTLLMMYKDESRSWRVYQQKAENLRVERLDRELKNLSTQERDNQIAELEKQVVAAREEWDQQQSSIQELTQKIQELTGRQQYLLRESKVNNARRDKSRADYDLLVRDAKPEAVLAAGLAEFDRREEAARAMALELEQVQTEINAINSELQARRAKLDEASSALVKVQTDEATLKEQRNLIRPEDTFVAWKRKFKELPIINGFNPHLKIQYDWAPDLEQTLGMTKVDRVDRCRTCHVNITEFGAGNVATYPQGEYEEPFCSHPRADLFLSASSPHPVTSFACTICHEGDGSGTSFQSAEHTAANPAQGAAWKHDHHWHRNHFWEYPMFPKQFVEASCLRCHHNVVELGVNDKFGASAPKVFKGYTLIRDYGCFGCHEINGFDGTRPIGPDMRLEPQTAEELAKIEADPNQIAGTMRKVGPSLRHVADKTSPEFVAYWTEDPQRFRPDTRMPKFFGLSNQHDAMAEVLQPIELAALASFLNEKSEKLDLLTPAEDYTPNAERGLDLFSKRGCLACHSREGEAFAGIDSNFGPDLSKVHEKIKPGKEGFDWLYTWIKEPTRHHPRTRMPDLYLDPYQQGEETIDPAADIAQFLLEGGAREFPALAQPTTYLGVALDDDFTAAKAKKLGIVEKEFRGVRVTEVIPGSPARRAKTETKSGKGKVAVEQAGILPEDVITKFNGEEVNTPERFRELESAAKAGQTASITLLRNGKERVFNVALSTPLDDMVQQYLVKSMTKERMEKLFETRRYPVTQEMYAEGANLSDFIKGDEIELAPRTFDEVVSEEEWARRKMTYIGRRTISRYGCYGCHDIPEFDTARPIGTPLQDWGRKDTSKLAYEHIHEFLHHHGDPNGGSTADRLERAVKASREGDKSVSDQELTEAYFYESVISHGRAGFLWQKLRDPRSYDFKKTETKGWDERLKMPKFPFNEEEIEAVATFVLGLVADPPAPEFQFRPEGAAGAKIAGERILAKFNCTGCHMMDMPEWTFGAHLDELIAPELSETDQEVFEKFKHLKPPIKGQVGRTLPNGEEVLRAKGYVQQYPDPEEDPEFQLYSFVLWDPVDLDDGRRLMPGQPLPIAAPSIVSQTPARGGDLAQWLAPRLVGEEPGVKDLNEAWQASPPPLVGQGAKVQTPWLYRFLKDPEQLRFTTVLRMPKFNMSDEEAQVLANYFAARDGAAFPYQTIEQRQPEFLRAQQKEFEAEFPHSEQDYLTTSWLVLNGPLCRKCHTVGGNVLTEVDPTQVKRGPNLQRVENRLRPDYVSLWVYNPKWILPYTSMPQNFPPGSKSAMADLFDGNNPAQARATVDALFNYTTLIEQHGETTYDPPGAEPAEGTAEAGEGQ